MAEVVDCRFMGEHWEIELKTERVSRVVLACSAEPHRGGDMVLTTFPPDAIRFTRSGTPFDIGSASR